MEYSEIPDYDSYEVWKNGHGEWEVKLIDGLGETLLHLMQDPEAPSDQIEDEMFYLTVDGQSLKWIREREGIHMEFEIGSTTDADYVELWTNGTKQETQHNHVHLDHDVRDGRMVPLTPA
jgi:hypothetical protein